MLYRTLVNSYANYQENKSFKFMEGTFDYFAGSDVYFAFFNGTEELSTMPEKTSGLSFNEAKSSCTNGASILWDSESWAPTIINLSTTKTKCTLYFDTQYKDSVIVTAPVLYQGLIPIKYNGNNMVTTDGASKWYDYANHEWANAILINYEDETVRNKYFNADMSVKTDVTVDIEDVLQMYVWIPRYKYLLWNAENGTSNPQAIDITFVDKSVTNPSGKLESEYKNGEYLIHPAFTFGDTELSGIWVGKFETSGKITIPTILPNQNSLVGLDIRSMFSILYNMKANKYGINKNNTDTHMMKNSEWGAVAYLSHSIYGRYTNSTTCIASGCEVWINSVSELVTGCSGKSVSESFSPPTPSGPDVPTPPTPTSLRPSSVSKVSIKTLNNTVNGECVEGYDWLNNGVNASTTGNVTGIYDMVGGAFEYVMGVMYDSDGVTPKYQSSGFDISSMPESKYYDIYAYSESTGTAIYHLGEGTRETLKTSSQAWYGDFAVAITTSHPWVHRGGGYYNGSVSGLFSFSTTIGGANSLSSFRATLTGK